MNAYLKLGSFEGEANAQGHEKWIKLASVEHVIDQKASPAPDGTGRMIAAAATHGALVVTKPVDKSSPTVAEACSSGAPIPKAEIHFVRASGDQRVPYLKIDLEKVIIAQVRFTAGNGVAATNGADYEASEPSETVALRYTKIKWTFQHQDADGKVLGSVAAGWDLSTQAKWG